MNTLAASQSLLTVEEFLAHESFYEVKHEYLGGVIYAMAGASEAHNIIAANLMGMLYDRLRGRPCQPFGSDMKVKLHALGDTYFYYPDAMIACDPTDSGHGWRERPTVLFEIISEETRRVDEREKRLAYHRIAELEAYVRIEQTHPELTLETRAAQGWQTEHFSELSARLTLSAVGIELPLSEIYERLTFPSAR